MWIGVVPYRVIFNETTEFRSFEDGFEDAMYAAYSMLTQTLAPNIHLQYENRVGNSDFYYVMIPWEGDLISMGRVKITMLVSSTATAAAA